jgi:nucleoid-associated protein YgaU
MVEFQEKHNVGRLIFTALFGMMFIIASGVLMLDRDRFSFQAAAIPFPESVTKTALADPVKPVHPAGVSNAISQPAAVLHKMHSESETDVTGLITTVARAFDDTRSGQALESYLVWAISAGKTDAYIDSLLNSAAAKGHFEVPLPLATLSGRLDTPSLLRSILVAAKHNDAVDKPLSTAAVQASQQHPLRLSDSLAGLSLAYYGDPLDHMRIAGANDTFNRIAEAQVGQMIEIPGF